MGTGPRLVEHTSVALHVPQRTPFFACNTGAGNRGGAGHLSVGLGVMLSSFSWSLLRGP